ELSGCRGRGQVDPGVRGNDVKDIHRRWSHDADVLELPGVVAIEILGKQPPAILQGRPVAPYADDIAEIRPADLEDALEVQFLRLDDAARRVVDRPNDAGKHRRRDLQ